MSSEAVPARRLRALPAIPLAQGLTVLVLLLAWEWAVRSNTVNALYLPAPTAIVESFGPLLAQGRLLHHTAVTLAEFAVGYAAAVFGGIGLGVLLVLVPSAERFAHPFIGALMSVPKVAIVPLLALWLGIGFTHKVAIVFLFAVFQIVYSTVAGIKQTRREHLKVARAFRASTLQTVFKVILPSAMPTIFAALRVSASVGLLGALFAEMLSSKEGLGNLITRSTASLDTAETFALIALVTLLAVAMIAALDLLERMVFLRWRAA
ncbi:ABC transporter permease [Variovorax sp. Sphag1AA]|uniref:ABC transporter permease n=1 Tax=Variovorax sp. Sphag1AA TaxID=2587027 RepID=UPI0017B6787F|nr:ABC transporter permease [Variovorax sp. Sphag1AA]MBB3181492.1 NitT/TauT family transport system permease protein [Variovorax sp. Sphag1AA]